MSEVSTVMDVVEKYGEHTLSCANDLFVKSRFIDALKHIVNMQFSNPSGNYDIHYGFRNSEVHGLTGVSSKVPYLIMGNSKKNIFMELLEDGEERHLFKIKADDETVLCIEYDREHTNIVHFQPGDWFRAVGDLIHDCILPIGLNTTETLTFEN